MRYVPPAFNRIIMAVEAMMFLQTTDSAVMLFIIRLFIVDFGGTASNISTVPTDIC